MRKILAILTLIVAQFTATAQFDYLPAMNRGYVVTHQYYVLSYSEEHEQAEWVGYMLTSSMLEGDVKRSNHFKADTSIATGSASPDDYYKSGYDRGHLCPAGDMTFSETAMRESFLMGNMAPQTPWLNRGPWRSIEGQERKLASTYDTVYFYIIDKRIDSLYGPMGLQEYLDTRNRMGLPKDFRMEVKL
jgi:endonuclease G